MKKLKTIVAIFTVFTMSMLLVGCGKNTPEKNSMSLEDFDIMPIPKAYSYEVFADSKSIDSGKGNFDSDTEFCNLFPIQSTVTKKEILSSQILNERICTDMTVYFEDGSKYDVQIENDPKTLELLDASVDNGEGFTLYTYTYSK